jgi:hypothetical protein
MDILPLETAPLPALAKTISVLRPNVTRDEAIALLAPSALRRWSRPLRSIAELYIPFQLFRARIIRRSITDEKLIAGDLFCGHLDPFEFPAPLASHRFQRMQTRNQPEAQISCQQAGEVVQSKLQRLIFQYGFFRVGQLKIEVEPVNTFHMPYWLGFYGRQQSISLEALDATRRLKEGAKFRRLVVDWLVRHESAD